MAEWKQAQFTVIPSDTLNSINDKLEQAINFLNSLEEGLDAISDLVSILALIENAINDFFGFLLSGIIDDFNRMIEDFKYTGVYALDLTSINFTNSLTIRKTEEDLVTQFAANQIDDTSNPGRKKLGATFKAPFTGTEGTIGLEILGGYKRQTYRQWLRIITDAFQDENDMPSYKAWGDLYSKVGGKEVQMEPFAKSTASSEISAESPHPYELAYLRPGRPNFGPNGHIDCYVFAFAAADFVTFIQTLGTLSRVFYDVTNPDEYKEMLDQYQKAWKGLKDGLDDSFNLFPGEYTNVRGTPPDFIGINAAQIFAPLFAILERLTNKLKSIFKTINTGIADLLEATIEALRRQIDEIREIITVLRQLIKLLGDILNLNGLYMLNITSDTGIAGIIEQLESATGFRGDEYDKTKRVGTKAPRLYIGGFLFCWGYPSTDSSNYNLSKAWDDRKKILKDRNVSISERYNRSTDTLKRLFG